MKKLWPTVQAASPRSESWMAKRDTANLVLNVRRDKKQEALQGALLVPWRQLAEAASAFAEWHMIILWVRVITETAEQLPQIVRSELQSRCPGFLESQRPRTKGQSSRLEVFGGVGHRSPIRHGKSRGLV